jgi:RTX calcium-binding nonapeptide repeat (4 copies)
MWNREVGQIVARVWVITAVTFLGLVLAAVGDAAAAVCSGRQATIVGTAGPDRLVGTPGRDVIAAGRGNDVIWALDGRDFICTGTGSDLVYAGLGSDNVSLLGGGNDKVWAGRGNDGIGFGPGRDIVHAGPGKDVIGDGRGNDRIDAGPGSDEIFLAGGADVSFGGSGEDATFDASGDDTLHGGPGPDFAALALGNDEFHGGQGLDIVTSAFEAPVTVDLGLGTFASPRGGLDMLTSVEIVNGEDDANDTLIGGPGADALFGQSGDDHLEGRAGNDLLDGGVGPPGFPDNDFLDGGDGTDTCRDGETVLNCEGPVVGNDFSQPHFRIRSDDSQTLNADAGWAAALDTNVTMDVEKKFRIRFEVENSGAAVNIGFKLLYRKNGGAWIDAAVVTNEAAPAVTESVEIRPSAQYADGDATTNILSGSSATFAAGTGNEDNDTGLWNNGTAHGEFEWAVLIRRTFGTFPNSPTGHNVDGDEFEFRLSTTAGDAFSETVLPPKVTLNVPARLLGGTIVETPGRMGPHKDGNGNLYYLMEYSETYPLAALMKSGDGGNTWVPQDVLSPPEKRDWESADILISGTELKVFQQQGQNVFFHTFRTSEDGTPDTWNIKDEVAAATQPSTNTNQCGSLVRRSDGSFVAFFCEDLSSSFGRVAYNVRSSGGTWGTEVIIDSEASTGFEWAVGVLGESDLTHIFYLDRTNGIVYYRTLTSGGTLSGRTQIATGLTGSGDSNIAGILPAVYYDDAGAEKVLVVYKKSDDKLYAVTVTDGTPGSEQAVTSETVVSNVGGSHSPGAALVVDGTTAYVLYGDNSTKDLWLRSSVNGAAWSSATEIEDNVTVDLVTASVFTHSAGNGGDKVIGYIFDNGSEGFTGKLTYGEHILQQGTPPPVGSSRSGSK